MPEDEPLSVPIVKAETIEIEVPEAQSTASPNERDGFSIDGTMGREVVPFPLPAGFKDPEVFVNIWRGSSALQPPIEAYASDIHTGHTFEPVFDPGADNARDHLREAHEVHRSWLVTFGGKKENELPPAPTDEELDEELTNIKAESRRQRIKAEYFFKSAVRETSFNRFRRNTCQQGETGGNWYWEVVTRNGMPMRLKLPPFQSMRALKEDVKPTKVTSRVQVTHVHWAELDEWRYFRRYVQKRESGNAVFFKQWGDPRVMCACCGTYYPRANGDPAKAKLIAKRQGHDTFREATEILHDGAMHVPGSPYFLPRWLGALNFVMGEDAASELNLAYFNQPVPSGLLLCAGGKMAADAKDQIKEYMRQVVQRGAKGFFRVLAISAVAESADLLKPGGAVKLEWVPLRGAQHSDAQFLEWLRYCEEKAGRQFRLHTLLFGGSGALNKATAWAVLKFAEERVYQPMREDFDDLVNRTLMARLGITLWRFRSKAPETRDPSMRAKPLDILQRGPALSVDQVLELAGEITGKDYPPHDKDWSRMPWRLLQYAHDDGESAKPLSELDTADGSEDSWEDHDAEPDVGQDEKE
jgi:capsid portal protein